jgi:hypothetical protein
VDLSAIIELLKLPVELVLAAMIYRISERQKRIADRLGVVEEKNGITYPQSLKE